jgi:hypothetical protein
MALKHMNGSVLSAYFALERAMVDLDDAGEIATAEALRDYMDSIWSLLSMAERELLDARHGRASVFAGGG